MLDAEEFWGGMERSQQHWRAPDPTPSFPVCPTPFLSLGISQQIETHKQSGYLLGEFKKYFYLSPTECPMLAPLMQTHSVNTAALVPVVGKEGQWNLLPRKYAQDQS